MKKLRSYFSSIYTPYEYNCLEALQTPGLYAFFFFFLKVFLMSMRQAVLLAVAWVTAQTFTWIFLLQVEEYTLILISGLQPKVFYGN